MKSDKTKGLVPVILAIIGLIADVIGIYSVTRGMEIAASKDGQQSILTVGILIIIYSWSVISWFLTVKKIEKDSTLKNFFAVSIESALPVGLGLSPIFIALIFTINTTYRATYCWIYFLFFPILSFALGLLMNNLYGERIEKNDVYENQAVATILISFFIILIFGSIGVSHKPRYSSANGKYTCNFPYNSQWLHIKQGQHVAVIYDFKESVFIITDSVGYYDKLKEDVLDTHFTKLE